MGVAGVAALAVEVGVDAGGVGVEALALTTWLIWVCEGFFLGGGGWLRLTGRLLGGGMFWGGRLGVECTGGCCGCWEGFGTVTGCGWGPLCPFIVALLSVCWVIHDATAAWNC